MDRVTQDLFEATMSHCSVIVIGSGSAGLTAALYAAQGEPGPGGLRGRRARRSADPDDERGQFSRLPRGDHGARADGPHAPAGPEVRGRNPLGDGFRGGSVEAAVPGQDDRRSERRPQERDRSGVFGRRADHRHGGVGPLARDRGAVSGRGREHVRHLRRCPVPGQGDRGGGWRGLGGRGSDVPDPVRQQGHSDSPPGPASGLEDHAGPAQGERENCLRLE